MVRPFCRALFVLALLCAVAATIAGCSPAEPSKSRGVTIHAFDVSPEQLAVAGEVAIHWRTSGAVSLELLQGDRNVELESQISQGSVLVLVDETETFTLIATGASGETATASRTVTVDAPAGPHIARFTAPEVVGADEAGEAHATLRWSGVARAAELRLEAPGRLPIELDPETAEGSLALTLIEDTTFKLVAKNGAEEFSLTAAVRVARLPIIDSFEAERDLVGFGESSLVSWTTTDAIFVELWQNEVLLEDQGLPEGSLDVVLTFTSSLELRAFNELGGITTATLDVEVGAPVILDLQISSGSLWLGEATTFSWQTIGGSVLELVLDESGEVICEELEPSRIRSATCTWEPPTRGVFPLTLTLSNLSGVVVDSAEVFASDGPLITHFDVTPRFLTAGDELEISWSVRGDPAGGEPSISLQDDRGNDYRVEAEGPDGLLFAELAEPGAYELQLEATTSHPRSSPDQASISLLVHPRPAVEFVATTDHFDDSIHDEVAISWTTRDAETVVLYQLVEGEAVELVEAVGLEREAGSYSFVPREARSFRLVATNSIGGQSSRDLEITVAATEVLSFVATPLSFTQGQEVRLSWEARMADEVTIDIGTKRYLLEETNAPYLDLPDIGGTHLPMTDKCGTLDIEGCAEFSFPGFFRFPFGDAHFDRVWIHTPGYLSFSASGTHSNSISTNLTFPTEPKDSSISLAPFWDSLAWDSLRYPGGNVYTALIEEAGEQTVVIQWRDLGYSSHRTASFNFEVVLRENGTFEFRYGVQSGRNSGIPAQYLSGSSATIGFQLPDQTDFSLLASNGQVPINGSVAQRTFSYKPLPMLQRAGELVFHPYGAESRFPITLTATRDGVSHSKSLNLEVTRKPIIDLSPEAIPPARLDEEFLLGWRSFNADTLAVVDEGGTIRCTASTPSAVAEGVCALSEDIAGRYRYTVRASGANGFVAERAVLVDAFGAFGVASFTAGANPIEKGGDVLLSWETFDASSITLFSDGAEVFSDGGGARTGSFLAKKVEQETEFKLVATNHVGAIEEATLTVTLWEITIGLQATATTVRPGEPITVTVDARTLDTGAPVKVYGLLPLAEVPGPGDRYADISGLPGAVDHKIDIAATSATVNIQLPPGFLFPFMGEVYSQLRTFADGYVSLNASAALLAANVALPTRTGQGANVHFAPFWDDLHPRGRGELHSARIGDDTFVIQWSKMSLNIGSTNANPQDLNFQLVLYRNGTFEYRYGTMAPHPTYRPTNCFPSDCNNEVNGAIATIGYQFSGGVAGHGYHFGGTTPAAGNLPVPGGLTNRTLRYQTVEGSGSFTFYPNKSETFSFCAISAGLPVCKVLEISADLDLISANLSKEVLAPGEPTTLSWTSIGGTRLNILDAETVVYTTTDPAEIDQGSTVLTPTKDTIYLVELLAGGRRDTMQKVVELSRFSMNATASRSEGPGGPVTISWNLSKVDATLELHVTAPMEEVTASVFHTYDLSLDEDAVLLIDADADDSNVRLDFFDFSFPFLGTEHRSIQVAIDGYLSWESSFSAAANLVIPNTAANVSGKSILPFWDDLHTRRSGRVLAKKLGADRYVIQWSHMSLKRGSDNFNQGDLNFLVVLHRDGTFEFHYGLMLAPPLPAAPEQADCFPTTCELESNGASATIGYQSPDGKGGHQIHFGGTHPGLGHQPVAGGLGYRGWKFTPRTGSGSLVVHPADSTTYKLCAVDSASRESVCAPTLGVDVPWGIDLFLVNPTAPAPGQQVILSWSAQNIDSLRLLANGTVLVAHLAPPIPLLGTAPHTPNGTTIYTIEATSMGRVVSQERTVSARAFDLSMTGPSGTFFPGETVVVDWALTPHLLGDVTMITPMSELLNGAEQAPFMDVSASPEAEEVQLSGTNGSAAIALPFTFPYLGTRQNSVEVFADGYLSFAGLGGNSNGNNVVLPTSSPVHLAVFWDDLIMRGGDSVWRYAPDPETLIIQWKKFNISASSSGIDRYDLNFQVVLRSNGTFDYRYGRMDPPPPPFAHSSCSPNSCTNEANGSGATIGYQSVDGRYASNLHAGSVAPRPPLQFGPEKVDGFLAFPGGLSHRSFRYSPALSGSANIVVGRTGAQEVCGIIGDFFECKSVGIDAAASSGELMITEMMIDPAPGMAGQWLEVRNLTTRTIDMQGFDLRSNQGIHRIASSLPVHPGGFVTLASSTAVPFTPTYVYGDGVPLNRLIDSLEILAGEAIVNTVRWGIDWRVPYGQVLSLDRSLHQTGVQENSDFAQWCNSGSSGSPGMQNPGCINPWYDVDPLSDRPFIDISGSGTRFYEVEGDDFRVRLPFDGFRVKLFGQAYSRVWVASDGWISLTDTPLGTSPLIGTPSPPRSLSAANSLKGPLISAFWNDLICGPTCRFFYEQRQDAGEKVLILQWDSFRLAPAGSVTFQVQLWEAGDVVIAFDEIDNPNPVGSIPWANYQGNGAWVGLESADPGVFATGHLKRLMNFEGRSFHFKRK